MEINKITFENMKNLGISQSFEDLDVNNDGVINEKDKSVTTNSTVLTKKILQKDKENWESYLELAKVCIALKETEKAEGYLVTLQEKNPTYRASEVASLLQSIK